MAETNQLNVGWLYKLPNPHHDGTTQQIDDFVQAFVTDNQVFNQKRAKLHQCRQKEDEVWLKSQRDPAVKRLEKADKDQDHYELAGHYILDAHGQLPDEEPTKAEANECKQIIKDFDFKTTDPYGAESDKIIQIHQNLLPHETFLTQIGAWTFFNKALTAAQQVRDILGERALTKAEFVKGELKLARRATDLAIADLYKTITAMMDLMPSAELTALYTQLHGIELYARQYYLNEGSTGSGNGGGTSNNGGGTTPTPDPENPDNPDTPDNPDNPGGGGETPVSVTAPNITGDTPFADTSSVVITAEQGAEIRYTTDGSTPTASSTLYSNSITLSDTATVKAIAIKNGTASEVTTKAFVKSSGGGGGFEG